MMKMRSTLLFLTLFSSLFIASCATTPAPSFPENQSTSWVNRAKTLATIKNWNLKGVIAIRTPQDAWSANWNWQQNYDNYVISLFGPLGSHSIKLTGTSGHVLLETADGKHAAANSPESLLSQELGWQIPVSYLRYWVRGLPVPGVTGLKQFDQFNHLRELNQQGWIISYLRYTSVNHIDVPDKIFLNNPELNVKIIINQWQLK